MLTQPHDVVKQLPVHDGDTVIDCGAGVSAYAIALANSVGTLGHVYAYDIQPGLVDTLAKEAKEAGVQQITALTVDLEHGIIPLKDAVAHGALLAHTLFQIGDKRHVIAEIARVLRPGGWLAIVEWRDSFQGIGPQLDYIVPEEQVHTLCDDAGLLYSAPLAVGSFQYGALFHKL